LKQSAKSMALSAKPMIPLLISFSSVFATHCFLLIVI
jgi:hypothetical protein